MAGKTGGGPGQGGGGDGRETVEFMDKVRKVWGFR